MTNDTSPTRIEIAALQRELTDLHYLAQRQVMQDIAAARENGGLSDNPDLVRAREKRGVIEARIAKIRKILATASHEVP